MAASFGEFVETFLVGTNVIRLQTSLLKLCCLQSCATSRQGSASLSPLGVPEYPWEDVGMDFVTDLPKSSKLQYTAFLSWYATYQKWLILFHIMSQGNHR